MNKILKLNWVNYCLIVFIITKIVLLYEYNFILNIMPKVHDSFLNMTCKWDCQWYLTIINNGYDLKLRTEPLIWKGAANWVFFPVYPYIIKYLSLMFHTNPISTAVFLNQILLFLSLLLFYKYLKLYLSELNSRFGVLLLAFSPFSIYYITIYTEPLFLFLSLLGFYLIKKEKFFLASLVGAILSGTRVVGIVFIVPYIILYYKKYKFKQEMILYILIISLGLLIFMDYMYYKVGDPLIFVHMQKVWMRPGFMYGHILLQLYYMILDMHNMIFFLIGMVLSLCLIKFSYIEEGVFGLLAIIPGFLSASTLGLARYSGALFTLYFSIVLLTQKSSASKLIILLIFILLYISYFLYWMLGWFNFLA